MPSLLNAVQFTQGMSTSLVLATLIACFKTDNVDRRGLISAYSALRVNSVHRIHSSVQLETAGRQLPTPIPAKLLQRDGRYFDPHLRTTS